MKNVLLIFFTSMLMIGCNKSELNENLTHIKESIKNQQILRDCMIVTIDSCQYVVSNVYGGYVYIHHNNCCFCKERRKKELEELTIILKVNKNL